ncbi:MAG: synthase delta chain [Bacillota bacterium]|jgi:F-type H+-transporting ATPase subunit delta|nr:synthase delta chain [Bacillota bacterium]
MTELTMNYSIVLFELKISHEIIHETKNIFLESRELLNALSNPSIQQNEKHSVIDSIFDKEIRNFLKVLSDNNKIDLIVNIIDAYDEVLLQSKNILKVTFTYVTIPDENQINQIKEFVRDKYNKADVLLELKEDSSLLGGFILTVGDIVYDKSIAGTLSSLRKTLAWR